MLTDVATHDSQPHYTEPAVWLTVTHPNPEPDPEFPDRRETLKQLQLTTKPQTLFVCKLFFRKYQTFLGAAVSSPALCAPPRYPLQAKKLPRLTAVGRRKPV